MNDGTMPRWGRDTEVRIEADPNSSGYRADSVMVSARYKHYHYAEICPTFMIQRVTRVVLERLALEVGRAAVMA